MGNLKKISAILILLTIVLAMSAVNAVYALGVTDTITVGNLPYGVAYDSIKSEIFVSNAGGIVGESTISVISDNNNTAVATIPTGEMPSAAGAIAYDSGKNEIFVTHLIVQATNTPSSVSVISDSTNTVAANIKVGNDPDGIAYDSGTGEIFVANNFDNTVSVISDSNNTVVATIPVGNEPDGVAYDSAKGEIFVANAGSGTVSVISDSNITPSPTAVPTTVPTAVPSPSPVPSSVPTPAPTVVPTPFTQVPSPAVVANVPVGNAPFGVTYDSAKGEIFVTNVNDDTVSVISDNSNTVIATVPVGENPQGLAYDSGKSEIFVANLASNQAASGVLSVITDSNNTVVATVPVGDAPEGVTYDSSKSAIFVTNFFDNRTAGGYFSDTVKVVSDSYPLAAPLVTSSHSTLVKGQTSKLTSAVTTGASPYTYQWFSEAPGASSYSSIGGATSSSYSFTASTSTATGNWSFTLQVTDSTGAAVNSTATTVIVNSNPTVPEFSTETIILVLSVMVVVSFCALVMVGKKNRLELSPIQSTQKNR